MEPVSVPVSVFDVAQYILSKTGTITTWKLQKLLYYAQAYSLVWDEQPIFNEEIQAWANGPVVKELFNEHVGKLNIDSTLLKRGDLHNLSNEQIATIDAVLETYNQYSGQELSFMTHREDPWINARKGLGPHEKCDRVISLGDMADYYSSFVSF
ncbi:MAG: DUF4065 domain-containing protein [Brevinematales bacterium]|nr:DUF4065 domain-containing protein [Brevinematales bacterium]